MLTKRIIPCLDVKEGRVVKGVNFVNLKDAGDPVELAKIYNNEGADELVFLDITASHENRKTMIEVVKKTAENIFIPFTVGGGISTIDDIKEILRAGADKVSLNTAAVKKPELIKTSSERFGSQCIIIAIDARKEKDNKWNVYIKGGREDTGLDVLEWALKVERLGAGEILLTSMDKDGVKEGYDIELTGLLGERLSIPVIASGGAGNMNDFKDIFLKGKADAALAASVFHFGTFSIKEVKSYLQQEGVEVRI